MRRRIQQEGTGFTLIELSIALVIIGLIVGGVLVGKDLIEAASLRNIVADIDRFEAARNTFQLKYACMPGDCANASQFGLGNNGNGNGMLDNVWSTNDAWLYWTHLAKANYIEGDYSGLPGPNIARQTIAGVNVPKAKGMDASYFIYNHLPNNTVWSLYFGVTESTNTHIYSIGKDGDDYTFDGAFTVKQAMAVNLKVDDGLANRGKWRSGNAVGCVTGAEPDFVYDTTADDALCNLLFLSFL